MQVRALLGPTLMFVLAACGSRASTADAGDEDESESSGQSSEATDSGDGDGDGDGETDEGEFLPEADLPGGANGGLGEMCDTDADCMEGLWCNGIPMLGSVCSECAGDLDCQEADAGLNCFFNGMYFQCGDGGLGQQCEQDDSCMDGLFCAEVVDFGGFFNGQFCSECETDDHCQNGQICNPQFDMMTGGQKTCVDPGAVPNDALCDYAGNGDLACASGHCEQVDAFMGFIQLGICGDCESDTDCPMGTCTGGSVSMGFDLMGSTCG